MAVAIQRKNFNGHFAISGHFTTHSAFNTEKQKHYESVLINACLAFDSQKKIATRLDMDTTSLS